MMRMGNIAEESEPQTDAPPQQESLLKQRKFSYLIPQNINIWSIFSKIAAAVPSFAVGRYRKRVTALITVVSKNLTNTTRSFASTPQSFDSSTRMLKKTGWEELVRVASTGHAPTWHRQIFQDRYLCPGTLKLPSNI